MAPRRWAGLLVAAALVAGCAVASAGPATPGPCTGASATAPYRHVVWIWMENHRRQQVVDSAQAPATTALAHGCATATDYRIVGRPSLPNYIGATAGDTFGIRDDGGPGSHPIAADNLFRQVRRAGGTARTYAEAMGQPCARRSAGRYGVKHNPATYYVGEDDRAACVHDVVPLGTTGGGALAGDLDGDTLPAFSLVIPDMCNDTHDCPVATGDRWLAAWIDRITGSAAYRAGTTLVVVAWDEPTPMPFVAVAPAIRPGTVVGQRIDHYALLRLTEDLLGLPRLRRAAVAADLRGLLGV